MLVTFEELFGHAGFRAPAVVVANRRRWRLKSGSSSVRLVFGDDDDGEYLEYASTSKFGGDRRGRIYGDGSHRPLDALQEGVYFDPSIPGSLELAEAAQAEWNRRVSEELQEAGLATEVDHDLIRDALAGAASFLRADWHHMLEGPRRENRLRASLRRSLEREVGELVEQERRLELGDGWPNLPSRKLGGADLVIRYMPQGEYWRYVLELKWSTPAQRKVWEGIWDALKMLAASQLHFVEAAYLVTGASRTEWINTPAAEIFEDGLWDVRELLSKYPEMWKTLVALSGPPPLRLPARFRTTLVGSQAVNDYVIRAVAVSAPGWDEPTLDFRDGFPI
jgi:hypothetical protein